MPGLQSGNGADLVGVAKVLGLKDAAELGDLRPSRLMRLTQRELLDAARVLGLSKVSKLNKQALLAKVWEALQLVGVIPVDEAAGQPAVVVPRKRGPVNGGSHAGGDLPGRPINVAPDPREVMESAPAAAHKFDVGEGTGIKPSQQDFTKLRHDAQAHIPWSYGHDIVTALPVDPDRLFVYWEVTQTAIDQARGGLGPAGKDAWLSLRIYDVTGRLFDGNNAHGYFDQGVGNDVRQWFFEMNRPTSQAIVEIGLKSSEGYFVKIARSGRLEFPRKEPVVWSDPEWMTVQVSTGYVEGTGVGLAAGWGSGGAMAQGQGAGWAGGAGGGGGAGGAGGTGFSEGGFETSVSMDSVPGVRRRIWLGRSHHELGGFEGQESWSWEEIDSEQLSPEIIQAFSWEGDSELTSWEAGPFEYPVEIPALVKESYNGPAKIFRTGGRTHMVWGPWQVIIKGLGAHAERRVISRWQMERAFTTRVWREVNSTATVAPLGSSGAGMGASERWGRAGSELRLQGASERYTLGASELRFAGASEQAFVGASQFLMRGATERLFKGASELAYAGASERRHAGASERRYGGASERRLGGASEWRLGGGSELRLGGSEPRLQATEIPRSEAPAEAATEAPPVSGGGLWPVVPAAGEG